MIETQLTYQMPFVTGDLGGVSQSGLRCGDLILKFGDTESSIPWRYDFDSWLTASEGDDWQLILQRVSKTWKGYPLSSGELNGWDLLLLGELTNALPSEGEGLGLLYDIVTGHTSAEKLNGHFLLLGYDRIKRQWHVFTDRFGTLHAYHSSDSRRAAIGTFSPSVASAASRKRLDWQAITAFFELGFFPQDRTFFDDVRILQPASHYVFDAAGKKLEQKKYWHWWHHPDSNRTYDDTVDEFGRIFREVMQDQTRDGRVALPISGGLDSRSTTIIAGNGNATTELGNLWSYSYGYTDDSIETEIARHIARARHLPFQSFLIKPYLFQNLDLVLDSVEGFQDITLCRQAAIINEITPNADFVIAAHWGDVWMDTMGMMDSNTDDSPNPGDGQVDKIVAHTVTKVRKGGSEWLLENVSPQGQNANNGKQHLRDIVHNEMSKLQEIECPDFRVKAFKTDNWSFRWTLASLRMFQPAAFPRLPFYDSRLADFFCSVPSSFVRGRRLQIDHMKRVAPDLAKIKWQAYDANLFNYEGHNSWLLPKRAVKKAWRVLSKKQVVERNWEVQFLGADGRVGLSRRLLTPGLRLHSMVSPAKVKGLLDDFFADPFAAKRGYTVSMLLTFSAWLEKYG